MVAEFFEKLVAEASETDEQQPVSPAGDADSFHYFSYGSNLLTERIHVHITGAVFVKTAMLSDFELTFFDRSERWQGAVASIERKPSAHVWGCVWRVPNALAAVLDAQEFGYHRMDVNVRVAPNNCADPLFLPETLLCRTYQYSNPDKKSNSPSPHYKHVIITGAREHKLPPVYIEWLETNFLTNGYRGPITLKLEAIQHLNNDEGGMIMIVENGENHVQQQQLQHQEGEEEEEKKKDD